MSDCQASDANCGSQQSLRLVKMERECFHTDWLAVGCIWIECDLHMDWLAVGCIWIECGLRICMWIGWGLHVDVIGASV